MNKYNFLKSMDLSELIALQNVTTDTILKENIKSVLGSDERKYSRDFYTSDRTVFINDALNDDYKKLIKCFKVSNLECFINLACLGLGNNEGFNSGLKKLDEAALIYGNPEVQKYLKEIGVNKYWEFHSLYNVGYFRDKNSIRERNLNLTIKKSELIKSLKEDIQYLDYFETFFSLEQNRNLFEGAYNTYMYIKENLHRMLAVENDISVDRLLSEQDEKYELDCEYLHEISIHLYTLKKRIMDSRLSAFNHKVSFIAKKQFSPLNDGQKQFAELVSYGMTKEELASKNFESAERLLYIPKKYI